MSHYRLVQLAPQLCELCRRRVAEVRLITSRTRMPVDDYCSACGRDEHTRREAAAPRLSRRTTPEARG